MEMIAGLAAAVASEAMKNWGVFTFLMIGLGFAYSISESRSKAKDEDIKALRLEVSRLQDLRLQDAREMIRVAETGTATMAARAEGDARFREMMSQFLALLPTPSTPSGSNRLLPPGSQ